MELTDLAPLETWVDLEKLVNKKSGLNASVFNTDGYRITDYQEWANRICPEIKAKDKGQSFICAVAHQNLATLSKNDRAPVIEECDAGLVKFVVPIFVKDEFLGIVGGCGLLLEGGEVDSFFVNKTTGIDTELIESLSEGTATITMSDIETMCQIVSEKIKSIISDYERNRK